MDALVNPDGDARRCDPAKPFGSPRALATLNTTAEEHGPSLSSDELTAYFGSTRGGNQDLYVATRLSRDLDFEAPVAVAGVNTPDIETWPSITGDGLALYATTVAAGGDISVATRASTMASFGALSPVAAVTGAGDEINPFVVSDHRALYFDSTRSGNGDLYRAQRNGDGTFAPPVLVTGVNLVTSAREATPVVSPDELTLVFSSPRSGGVGGFDMYMATRASAASAFGEPVNIAALNTAADEFPTWLSADGCVLYFENNPGNAKYDMFVATRPL